MMTRRELIQKGALVTVALGGASLLRAQEDPVQKQVDALFAPPQPTIGVAPEPAPPFAPSMAPDLGPGDKGPFALPKLPYAYDALEPHIDAETMEIHHTKHHQAYLNNLNKVISENASLKRETMYRFLHDLWDFPPEIRDTVRNNAGGHANHSLFWHSMKKGGGGQPKGDVAKGIEKKWGTFDKFKEEFIKSALSVFGSGWAWLSLRRERDELLIETTRNQDSPLMNHMSPRSDLQPEIARRFGISRSAGLPLIGVDVWEHAYYLKYKNRRADYVAAYFNVINWDLATERYREEMAKRE